MAVKLKICKLPETGGADVLLKRTKDGGDFEAVAYTRRPNSGISHLPEGSYEIGTCTLHEKYSAWAFHARNELDNTEAFEQATAQMAAISVKLESKRNRV